MNQDEKFLEAFKKYLPEASVPYCFHLWKEKPFNFFVTKERLTKLGDFRFRKDRKLQTISINHNLNPYQFLITFIHEVAHYRAFEDHGLGIRPHGGEWKSTFRNLMLPLLSEKVFPKDILMALNRHFRNPKASTGSDLFLSKTLKSYDKNESNGKSLLVDLPKGEVFELQGRKFQKEQIRRTRILCAELDTGRKYLISAHAEVKRIHQSES
jgi:hypothetical protein